MRRIGPLRIGAVLAVLLLVTACVFFAGRPSLTAQPGSSVTSPGGLGALAELLRRQGYRTVASRRLVPRLEPTDVAVVPTLPNESDDVTKPEDALNRHAAQGGTVVMLPFLPVFTLDELKPRDDVVDIGGTRYQVTSFAPALLVVGPSETGPTKSVVTGGDATFCEVSAVGRGLWVTFGNGAVASNRYLSKRQNAAAVADIVRRVSPPGSRVVFVESLAGQIDEPGLLGSIGDWAVAAQWQVLLLLALVAVTLGSRFGWPESARRQQRGARDLTDAMAELLRTGKKGPFAARIIADAVLRRLRNVFRMPPSATEEAVLQRCPEDYVTAFQAAIDPQAGSSGSGRVQRVSDLLAGTRDIEIAHKGPGRR